MMIRTLTPAPTTASTLRPGAIRTDTALLLRAEGLVAFAAALGGYVNLTDNWLLLVATVLLPDLAMIGYAFGSRIGARAYNAAHTYTAPALLAVLALATSLPLLPLACVWIAHIGIDRALGYGLKQPTGFRDTHLGRIGGREWLDARETFGWRSSGVGTAIPVQSGSAWSVGWVESEASQSLDAQPPRPAPTAQGRGGVAEDDLREGNEG